MVTLFEKKKNLWDLICLFFPLFVSSLKTCARVVLNHWSFFVIFFISSVACSATTHGVGGSWFALLGENQGFKKKASAKILQVDEHFL